MVEGDRYAESGALVSEAAVAMKKRGVSRPVVACVAQRQTQGTWCEVSRWNAATTGSAIGAVVAVSGVGAMKAGTVVYSCHRMSAMLLCM